MSKYLLLIGLVAGLAVVGLIRFLEYRAYNSGVSDKTEEIATQSLEDYNATRKKADAVPRATDADHARSLLEQYLAK